MDYLKPTEVVASMIEAGTRKSKLSIMDLLVRGAMSGGILGIATTLAITAAVQTNVPLVGAIIFPVGFVMIVLLGLELVTGSFAVLPVAQMDGKITFAATLRNWTWAFVGNLIGSVLFVILAWGALTMCGETPAGPVGDRIVQDRMLESGRELWSWIADGATIYVCGDAERMAKDVDSALQTIIAKHGGRSAAKAQLELREMAAAGRYVRDVY